jgi:hypothetical protein
MAPPIAVTSAEENALQFHADTFRRQASAGIGAAAFRLDINRRLIAADIRALAANLEGRGLTGG